MSRFASAVRSAQRWALYSSVVTVFVACADPTTPASNGLEVALAKNSRSNSSLALTVNGVPAGSASVRVTGPSNYSRTVSGSTTLTGLGNGTYTVAASSVVVSGQSYTPTPTSQTVSVSNGSTGRATVSYKTAATTGSLTVTVSMPDATPAAVTVTGPNSFVASVTATRTLSALAPGTYTVTAANVTSSGGATYVPSPTTQNASVTAGATAAAAVAYAVVAPPPPPGLNFSIAGMYITQSVQAFADTVPLVAGRDGLLRVFVVASEANSSQPTVRARVYRNGTLVSTLTASAGSASVPLSVDESSLANSWNFLLPGSLIGGGLSIVADVDPSNSIVESLETDNSFPVSGTPKAFNVRAVPNVAMKFVPIYQDTTLKGNVSASNTDAFLQRTRDMHPINTITTSIRAPYTTSSRILSDGTNWSNVLSELRAAQLSDGSSDMYYGVAKVTYGSGVAGIGYIGAPAAMGWDYLPSGSDVMAHELGHNWGRQHAPCGGVAGPDAAFPYAGGVIGTYGYSTRTNTLYGKSTPDLMGYCSPTWISDYTYLNVLKYRGSSVAALQTAAAVQPSLLVWGQVSADGSIELEPAVRLAARPVMPKSAGGYSVQGTDANGNAVFSLSFNPEMIADETGKSAGTFAFIVPMSEAAQQGLASITARGKGRAALQSAKLAPQALSETADLVALSSNGVGRARATWNAQSAKMVVLRDATTGEVLSFARGGDATIRTNTANLEIIVSDGVHSTSRRVVVKNFR